ncbi:reverse transcriptase domain-containing protein, partial [Tanacetum coccineum]
VPRAWFQRFASYAPRVGFSLVDVILPCLFIAMVCSSLRGKYASRTPVDTKSKLGLDGDPILDPTLYRSLAGGGVPFYSTVYFSNGVFYTWIKSPLNPQNSILKKLDRVMVNEDLMLKYLAVNALFLPYLAFDHSLVVCRGNLKVAQVNLDNNPHSRELKEREVIALKEYNEAVKDEESLISQKAKGVFGTKLNNEEAVDMLRDVTDSEIKNAMFDIGDNKALGPDGYTSTFYKNAWKIMGKDVHKYPYQVLKMIGEVVLKALADHKSIMYGSRFERFGVKFYVELKYLRIVALRLIMPPRMTTRSAGRATAAPRGGRTGGRTGRGDGRTRGRSGDQGNGGIDGQGSQVGGQGNQGRNQGNDRNQKGDVVNDNIRGYVRNVIKNNNHRGCTYKEFLACNPKGDSQKVKYTAGSFVGKALTWWNSQIHTRSREADVSMSWEDFKTLTREEFCPKAGTLTDEAVRNGSLKKNPEKRGNSGESSRDRNVRDENKKTRTGNAFPTTTNPVRREYNGIIPKCVSYNLHHPSEMPCRACFNCGLLGHMAKDCRVAPRMVNPVNARNPTAAPGACYECGGTDHFKAICPRGQGRGNIGNQARGRAFMLGAEKARQDLNIVTATFTLNDHYATTLFDFGADYSFVSTTFIPLLGIEPSDLGFKFGPQQNMMFWGITS